MEANDNLQFNADLVNDNVYTIFFQKSIRSQDIENKNRILTSIKGCNFVANLRKITFYNPKVDLVKDIVYTKFGLSKSIRSQDIEDKNNSDTKQGP